MNATPYLTRSSPPPVEATTQLAPPAPLWTGRSSSTMSRVETAADIEPATDLISSSGHFIILEKTPIPSTDRHLAIPLVCEVQVTRDGYVLVSHALDEDGFGATLDEACADLLTSLLDRLGSLERAPVSQETRLSDRDKAILSELKRVLGRDP
jgi:hypothetical protein